jgi:hypothetical protein
LLGGGAGTDSVLGLLVDVLAGQFGSDRLSRSGISAPVSNVEAIRNIVAAGVYLDLNAIAHHVDDALNGLASHSLRSVEVVLLDERFERAATGEHLCDAR